MIFTTGLLLDLLGSVYFQFVEVRILIANLRRNKRWLERVVTENKDFIQEDWLQLLDAPPFWSKTQLFLAYKVRFWKGSYWREYAEAVIQPLRLRKPYTRMQSFLLIYVLLASGVDKIELLSTQINIWNTSRAIAAAMMLGALLTIIPLYYALGDPSFSQTLYIIMSLYFTLICLAFATIYGAYARVCSTLFALAYIVASRTPVTVETTGAK